MPILRKKVVTNFSVLSNELLRAKDLSFEAVGVLVNILSYPANWDIYKFSLYRKYAGSTKINRIFKELQKAGYLHCFNLRENGKIAKRIWFASDYRITSKEELKKAVESFSLIDKTLNKGNLKLRKPQIKETLNEGNTLLLNNIIYNNNININKNYSDFTIDDKFLDNPINPDDIKALTIGAIEILKFLNKAANRSYRLVETNLLPIIERLKTKVTVRECWQIIVHKRKEWKGTNIEKYLRLSTLFEKNFEDYLSEIRGFNEKVKQKIEKKQEETKLKKITFKDYLEIMRQEYGEEYYQKLVEVEKNYDESQIPPRIIENAKKSS